MYDAKNIPCHDVKMGQGPRDPGPPPSLKMRPGTSLKFKSGIPGPPSKFKSGRNIYIYEIYIYAIFMKSLVSHLVCLTHWRYLFLVVEGETHATCLASNLPDNS